MELFFSSYLLIDNGYKFLKVIENFDGKVYSKNFKKLKMPRFCPQCGKKVKSDPNKESKQICPKCGFNFTEREKKIRNLGSSKTYEEEIYADIFQRLAAFFIDSLIIGLLTGIIISLTHLPIVLYDPLAFYTDFYYFWIALFFNWVIGFFYCCLLEAYNEGQTVGKRILRIRTVDEKSLEVAEPDQYAVTNLVKTSPFILIDFLVGFLISDRDSNKVLRYLQYRSKTVVIEIKKLIHK
jgi:uncharacterized RDD family membrane protein YckC/DNA-directed RNA polymerase subunit RPC12/RpoP